MVIMKMNKLTEEEFEKVSSTVSSKNVPLSFDKVKTIM